MRRSEPHEHPVVGVLGGGQLGRMLGLAGVAMGVGFRFLDPSPAAGAGTLGSLVVGELADPDAARALAAGTDVVTYEWEGVPAVVAEALDVPVYPPPAALRTAQDRLLEKELFRTLGIGVPEFVAVDDLDGLRAGLASLDSAAIVKTRRGGYDGKGQARLDSPVDVQPAWRALGEKPLIVEARVPFDRELSVLAVRSVDGETRCWPVVENHHDQGILRRSLAPAPGLTAALQARAASIAERLLDELDYVGVLTVELFEVGGELLANEIAPRVHNSGHWTIEGAATSQFENHVRAVLGWPLGSTEPVGASAMVNCIGVLPDPPAVLALDGAHLHRYAKTPRPGRKVGHVTVTAPDADSLAERLAALLAVLPESDG